MVVTIRNLRPGRQQTIEGKVVRLIDDDDFVLRDRTGRILVDLDLDRRLPLQAGQRVRVVGRLDQDGFDFDAQRVVRPNGAVLFDQFSPRTLGFQSNALTRTNSNPDSLTDQRQPTAQQTLQALTIPSLETLTGTVERLVDDDDFILRDTNGQILIDANLDARFLSLRAGEGVTVVGQLDPDDADFDALRITRADGTVLYDRLAGSNPLPIGINRTGTNRNDTLTGSANTDQLSGLGSSDRLLGAAGDDILIGGDGRDTLVGGAGRDRFVYQTLQQGRDRIIEFSTAEDAIDLRSLFRGVRAIEAQPVAEYVRFNQAGARTQVQVDLDGSGGRFSFRTLATLEQTAADALTAQNILI